MAPRLALLAIVACAALLSGCVQDSVSNTTNAFSYGGQVANLSTTKTYTWQNTVGSTMVNWGGQSSSGSFTLTLKDAAGKSIYTKTVGGQQQSGFNENTGSGAPGGWTVQLEFKAFTGQMGLNLVASGGSGGASGSYCPPNVPYC